MLTQAELATLNANQLATLYSEHGPGLSDSLLSQKRVPLHLLYTAEKCFQPRNKFEHAVHKREHIKTLAKAIKQRGVLDPIVVLAVDGLRVVVDGHCRLEAYRAAGFKDKRGIPVRHLKGTFGDALKYAASRNSKDSLPWTPAERRNAAWTMICSSSAQRIGWTVREIADMTGTSKSVVGRMKKKLQELLESPDRDPHGLSWRDAQQIGAPPVDYNEDWEQKKLRELEEKIGRALGPLPIHQPELFRDAFLTLYPHMLEVFGAEYVNSEEFASNSEEGSDF